jgi:hypothetical protein
LAYVSPGPLARLVLLAACIFLVSEDEGNKLLRKVCEVFPYYGGTRDQNIILFIITAMRTSDLKHCDMSAESQNCGTSRDGSENTPVVGQCNVTEATLTYAAIELLEAVFSVRSCQGSIDDPIESNSPNSDISCHVFSD